MLEPIDNRESQDNVRGDIRISHHPRVKNTRELGQATLEKFLRLRGPEDFEKNKGIELPNDPTFLKVAELKVHGVKVDGKPGRYISNLTLRDVNVFICHGESDRDQFYTVHDGVSIPDLIAKFKERADLSAVIVCNEGSFRLTDDLIYPIGKPPPIPAVFNRENGITINVHLAFEHKDFRPVFHIPEKLLTSNE